MTDQSEEELKYRELLAENLRIYGTDRGEPDMDSGRSIEFDDRKIGSFFNTDKTAIGFQFFIQGHQTAELTLSTKAAFFLMRLIDERLAELDKTEGKT